MQVRQLRGWLMRLVGLFNREKQDRELAEELESHLQMHIEDNLRAGLAPDEARRLALIKLGGLEPTKEKYRRQRGLPLIETLVQDLRYGLRMLVKRPGFTLIAVLSLGLGIGANTAIFSIVNTAALRPWPVERPDSLVSLQNAGSRRVSTTFSYPNYKDFRDRNDCMADLIGYRFAPVSVSYDGVNEKMWGYVVTGNYFEGLGVKAALGRVISPDDDRLPGAHAVTVVSYKCFEQRFGADPSVIGKSLIVNGRSFTVIGVAPKGFFGTEIIVEPQLWFPMMMQAEIEMGNAWLDKRDEEYTLVLGRLNPGVSLEQAQAALVSVAAQLESEYPDDNEGKRVLLAPTGAGLIGGMMVGRVLGFAGLLMVVVALVLLLACVNLANLLLARATERRNEIALRLALGASRRRVVLQLMTESMLLAISSGAFGLLLAYWLVRLVGGFKLPVDYPLLIDLHIDYRVLAFTCLTSLVTGALFGLLPALQSTKVDLVSALKDETSQSGHRRSWLNSSLIVLQVAVSLVLLVGGSLMLRALGRAQSITLGFNPQNAVAVSVDLRLQGYDKARGREFQKALLERVRTLPGVQGAGIVDLAPVDLHFGGGRVFIEGQVPELSRAPRAMASRVSPGYFQAMGTRFLQGRDFTERDDENAPRVAIINETFARRFWPGEDPLGKRFSFGSPDSPVMQVVGIVQDGKYAGLNEEAQPYVCRPFLQAYSGSTTVIARTAADPQKLITMIRNEVAQLDPLLPISSTSMVEKMALVLLPARVTASLFGLFGLLALALAAIGIYGVMSYSVSRRTHEIGVRMALGAQPSDVLKLAIKQGMILAVIGVVIGISASLVLTQSMKSLLFGVSATDPLAYAGVAALLMGVAMLACYIPARRATKINPMTALRYK